MLNNTYEAQPILSNAKVCKPRDEKQIYIYLRNKHFLKAENSRAISARFVRDLRRICSGIAPDLRAIPVEITRKCGKDCA